MSDSPVVQYASRTDVGMRRAANQDSLAVRLCADMDEWLMCGHLFAVADGMGGHSVGDLASRISVDTLPLAYFKAEASSIPERLLTAITAANRAINMKARENPEFADMGTTCSALALSADGAFVGHVGDSRVYRVRHGQIQQLSFDHSLQWEMVRQGRATIENVDLLHPRNVITRCLGPDQNVAIDIEGPFHVQSGDRFVICSDGLTGHLSDSEIGAITASLCPADSARLLINLANCRGGTDNVTVVVASVQEYPELSGTFEDSAEQKVKAAPAAPRLKGRTTTLISQISLVVFLMMATVGLGFLALGNVSSGLLLVCPAVILGFLRLIFINHQPKDAAALADTAPSTSMIPDDSLPAASSPYRTASARIEPQLLEFLAEAQSELAQAARDNGWEVDMAALADLNRQALAALGQKKPAECIRLRAKAIDELMKELYSHMRRS